MSFPRYPKYKDSGVEWLGQVPEHWDVQPGRRLFAQKRQAAFPEDEQLSATQRYGVVPQQQFMEREDQKVALALQGLNGFKHVEIGDFVISLRSFEGGIERSSYQGCVSPAYTVLRPTVEIDGQFWAYLLKSSGYVDALRSTTDGIRDGKTISYEQFGKIVVPSAPLAEQAEVARFLLRETAKIDALVAEQERLIELLKEKRQAVISHGVTKGLNPAAPMKDSGVEWLGQVPAHWEVGRVRTASSFVTSGPRGWSERISEIGALFIQSGDLDQTLGIEFASAQRVEVGADAEANRTRLSEGDVVVCITGAKTGNVAVCESMPEPAYVNQHLCLIRPRKNVVPMFLGLLLGGQVGQTHFELSQYGLKQGLSLEDVKETPFFLPPIGEQLQIVAAVGEASVKAAALVNEGLSAIRLLQERRTALIFAAVTGQIDVRNVEKRSV